MGDERRVIKKNEPWEVIDCLHQDKKIIGSVDASIR